MALTELLVVAAMLAATSSGRAQDPPGGEPRAPPSDRSRPPAAEEAPEQAQPRQAPRAAQQAEAPQPAEAAQSPASDENEPSVQPSASAADVPYSVQCGPDPEEGGNVCFVDRNTYVGWRTFHSVCHTCHAQDAVGSTFAPDLLARMRTIDKAQFLIALDQGFTGQVGVMPAWGSNPNVNKYYEELWSYLRARADGALPPGRPKRLPDSR